MPNRQIQAYARAICRGWRVAGNGYLFLSWRTTRALPLIRRVLDQPYSRIQDANQNRALSVVCSPFTPGTEVLRTFRALNSASQSHLEQTALASIHLSLLLSTRDL